MKINECSVKDFVENKEAKLIIDVRSPVEYNRGNIPGSVNIPLFSDNERKEIGILYKNTGKEKAFLEGLKFAQPKLVLFIEKITAIMKQTKKEKVFVYCQRGGARSNAFAWLLSASGINTERIKSGYKAYRNFILDVFTQKYKFVILGGMTGCGKTDILNEIEKQGNQVIDLEELACHKGSVFGNLSGKAQPSSQQFENSLGQKLYSFEKNKIIWIENESSAIGNLFIPFEIRQTMKFSPVIDINLPIEERLKRILREYGCFSKDEIIKRIEKIQKKLGSKNCEKAVNYVSENQIEDAAKILIHYYDKTYGHYLKKNNGKKIFSLFLQRDNPYENSKIILDSDFINSF
ncbi:MAG: tRNA 2-selenouridine(34) synthase MnmH [Deltaproteobacteria bacterium]|nr:MAG: tRNA 2-selenouridine(34) synthase MnmH [Deltaproteobacteria bacterium]PIE74954.1 MAG: tRNA 2-selenouridine(34) synthase MnmH [Deltaproteobacteria bacterium]